MKFLDFNTRVTKGGLNGMNDAIRDWIKCIFDKEEIVKKPELKDDRSYSCLLPLDNTGMGLAMFPGSNRLDRKLNVFHRCYAIQLFFPYPFACLFDSDTLHYGKKARTGESIETGEIVYWEDTRAFMYIQQVRHFDENNNTRSQSSVKPESDRVYRPTMPCDHLLNYPDQCILCKRHNIIGEKNIDIGKIYGDENLKSLPEGSVVLGNLEEFGFVIFKSFEIDIGTQGAVKDLKYTRRNLSEGLTRQPNRRIAFPASKQDVVNEVDQEYHSINIHLTKVVKELLHGHFVPKTCTMVKPNLIWNAGEIEFDQMAHYDYDESGRIISYNENFLSKNSHLK